MFWWRPNLFLGTSPGILKSSFQPLSLLRFFILNWPMMHFSLQLKPSCRPLYCFQPLSRCSVPNYAISLFLFASTCKIIMSTPALDVSNLSLDVPVADDAISTFVSAIKTFISTPALNVSNPSLDVPVGTKWSYLCTPLMWCRQKAVKHIHPPTSYIRSE